MERSKNLAEGQEVHLFAFSAQVSQSGLQASQVGGVFRVFWKKEGGQKSRQFFLVPMVTSKAVATQVRQSEGSGPVQVAHKGWHLVQIPNSTTPKRPLGQESTQAPSERNLVLSHL